MKRKNKDNQFSHPPAKRKISEMILEFAGDFISMGETQEQKQSHLNAACSAWNIACIPADKRQKALDRYMTEYQRLNPQMDQAGYAHALNDMEKLIEVKLKLFPMDLRQIVNARFVRVGDQERLEAAAITVG
jgi:hypothetical protein